LCDATDEKKASSTATTTTTITEKKKLSLLESYRVLLRDPYIRNLAVMVLCYGLAIEFTEITWKATVKRGNVHDCDDMAIRSSHATDNLMKMT
jgi:ATP/ADP translocase